MMIDIDLILYEKLYLIHSAENAIIENYHKDEMRTPMHMSCGAESIAVGVCQALKYEDQVFATYRSHAAFLAKTGDTDSFFGELYGKILGSGEGKCGSMHLSKPNKGHMLSSAIVATPIPVALGAAFSNKVKKNGLISCVFFGDGALDEGSFWESLNIACVMKLPILFVCEDNNYAVHTLKSERQGYKSIDKIVSNFNCSNYELTKAGVGTIFRIASYLAENTRNSNIPSFLHINYYRYLEHVGIKADFDAGYRSIDEFYEWLDYDSIKNLREKIITDEYRLNIVLNIEYKINTLVKTSLLKAQVSNSPISLDLYKGLFHETN